MGTESGNDERDRSAGPRRSSAPSGGDYAGMGLQFGGSILIFAYAGYWLDRRLGTSPWFLLVLVFVGAGAAFYSMYRRLFGVKPADGPR